MPGQKSQKRPEIILISDRSQWSRIKRRIFLISKFAPMAYTNITKVGTDHTIWQRGFGFYKDELAIMGRRLSEVSEKNTAFEARQGVEHFQNQFIVQKNNLDELSHEVNVYITKLNLDALKHQGRADEVMLEEHLALHAKYEDFERIMNALRHEFNEYLAKWL
jgi:uncharacterized membrane protein